MQFWITLPSDAIKSIVQIKHIRFEEMLQVFGVCPIDIYQTSELVVNGAASSTCKIKTYLWPPEV